VRLGKKDVSDDQLRDLERCFSILKAESDNNIDDGAFVRTAAFIELADRQVNRSNTVVLGRKGDGKTALLRRLQFELQSSQAQQPGSAPVEVFCSINVQETFFVELIDQFETISARIHADFPRISIEHISRKLWTRFFSLTSLQLALDEVYALRPERRTEYAAVEAMINDEIGSPRLIGEPDVNHNFLSLLRTLVRRLSLSDEAIADDLDESRERAFEPLSILRELPRDLVIAARDIGSEPVRLTISIDQFDDYIDHLISSGLHGTRRLRRAFLHGLISALYDMERRTEFRWLRIVASLPALQLRWSVNDLEQMLDNRVKVVLPDACWDDLFPAQIANKNKNVQRKERCTDYIIRHSTRRPRELMTHASAIIRRTRRGQQALTPKELSEVVAETNKAIVRDQVVAEWKSVVPDLEKLFNRQFREKPSTVFSLAELSRWSTLQAINSAFYVSPSSIPEEWRTIFALAVLFRIGVVGFRVRQVEPGQGYVHQGDNDYARYIYSHSRVTDPIRDVVSLLQSPKLEQEIESDSSRAIRAMLQSGRDQDYDIRLCLSPLFFESLQAAHVERYVVGEINDDDRTDT
jgi:hypothetical protein